MFVFTGQRLRMGAGNIIAILSLSLLLASCAAPRSATSELPPPAPPQDYTRIARPDTNTVQLQIAMRKFVSAGRKGPVVWLAGASHIGEPEYYKSLQKHLDAQTLVLYEGVNAGTHKRRVRELPQAPPKTSAPSQGEHEGLQSKLANSLGLVFQLDAIDYERTNFLNSDLSIQELEKLMAGNGGQLSAPGTEAGQKPGGGNSSLQYLMQVMDGSSFMGSIMRMGMQFIGSSPRLQAISKLTLIETLGRLKGDLSTMQGLPPDWQQLVRVLIQARDQTVIEDLKAESRRVPISGSIAIFYGTGHMADMEQRLTRDLNYRPAGEIWLTAFSADLRQTGMSASELESLRQLIQWQMEQMQIKPR